MALVLCLSAGAEPAEAVELHLRLEGGPHGSKAERERVRDLEYALLSRLAAAGAGELVRDEWRGGECVLHLAGKDATALWAAAEPEVRTYRPLPGSHAILHHGGKGARDERIELGEAAR